MKIRCAWCENQFDEYLRYHDEEWGTPVHDDRIHFEFLILEGAQAGLSWSTILKRRSGYRKAFAEYDVKKVASYDESKIQELLNDPAILNAVNSGDFTTLMSNPKFINILQNPTIQKIQKKVTKE